MLLLFQVEQLNILNAINKSTFPKIDSNPSTDGDIVMKNEFVDPESQELDLTVPNYNSEEEEEDDIF